MILKMVLTSTLLVFTQVTCMEPTSYNPQEQLFKICERLYYNTAISSGVSEADMVEYVIAQGANVNAKDKRLDTPLHLVAKTGAYHIAKTLLQHGANPRSTDLTWETPLHLAVRGQKDEFILTLLAHDPKLITIKDNVGNTPLHRAVMSTAGSPLFIKWLIDAQKHYAPGSDILEKNNTNQTAADLAKSFLYNEELADLITQWALQPK